MQSNSQIEVAIQKHSDMVRRICFLYMKNYNDVQDVFQEVFLKRLMYNGEFECEQHEKAWFAKVTINKCKDSLKSVFRKKVMSLEDIEYEVPFTDKVDIDVMQTVLSLPTKYRNVTYLYYYEGYSVEQISKIIGKNENTIYTQLGRAKAMLKQALGGDYIED